MSGDYFITHANSIQAPGAVALRSAAPAEFTVGSDGAIKMLGISTEKEMGPNGRIWFQKLE